MSHRPFGGSQPWGPGRAFGAFGISLSLFILSSLIVALAVEIQGYEVILSDPSIIDAARDIAAYADERLRAIALGEAIPDPPQILPNAEILRIAFSATIVFQVITIGATVAVSGRSPGELLRLFRLDRFDARRLARPAIATFAAYVGVAVYAIIVQVLDIDILIPESTVPSAVTRDSVALALAGVAAVIMAPISEEILYRGLIMGGLLKWGFLPAAVISSAMFSAVHFDIGSLIPFFGVGMVLAWLYWSGGRLWDAILFHFFFNLMSYLILVSTGG